MRRRAAPARRRVLGLATLFAFAALGPVASGAGGGAASSAAPAEGWLVTLHGPADDVVGVVVARGGRVLERFAFIDALRVLLPAREADALRALPQVAGVYPEEPEQALLASSRPAVRVGPELWEQGPRGARSVVAIVDSGIDAQHPDLEGRVLASVRVDQGGVHAGAGDRDGHGTHIAGIIAGDGSASAGANGGMAPEARLVAVDISGEFTTTNAVRAFGWLHDHAEELDLRVVSNSWGREKEDARYDPDDPVIRASDALVEQGIVVVFSAGNRGPGPGTLTVESQNPNVIAVGASSDQGRVEGYSSRGPAKLRDGSQAAWTKPDLVAPGTHVTSARAGASQGGDAYVVLNGTSMAAPHVAGVVALMLDADPGLSPGDVRTLLARTAADRGASGADLDYGAGFLDGTASVLAAQALAGTPVQPEARPFHSSGEVRPVAAEATRAPAQPLRGALEQVVPAGEREVRVSVEVPAGTVGFEVTLRWDDPRAQFEVTLQRGDRVLGPWRAARQEGGQMVLRAQVEGPLQEGTWTLLAQPAGPSAGTAYSVDGQVLVLHRLPLDHVLPPARRPGGFGLGFGAEDGLANPAWWLALPGLGPLVGLAWVWRASGRSRRRDGAPAGAAAASARRSPSPPAVTREP